MKRRTVILAAGEFPRRDGEPLRLLRAAERVIACDSAANEFQRRFDRWPDLAIGDLDSIGDVQCPAVRIADQETNDLTKAIRYCRQQNWNDLVIVGATGLREDHTIGNIFRALEEGVPLVTEEGEFLPIEGTLRLKLPKGTAVSVFATDPETRMTSRGLKWKLDGVRFLNPACATLNRTSAANVTVTSSRPAFLFVANNPNEKLLVISLGSNLGDRAAYLRRARSALAAMPETRLVDEGEILETEPVDVPVEFRHLRFLNQIVLLKTTLGPFAFSRAMHAIEDRLGRVRTVRNGPRTIDIDLISYQGFRVSTPELTLPHPRASIRQFIKRFIRALGLSVFR